MRSPDMGTSQPRIMPPLRQSQPSWPGKEVRKHFPHRPAPLGLLGPVSEHNLKMLQGHSPLSSVLIHAWSVVSRYRAK